MHSSSPFKCACAVLRMCVYARMPSVCARACACACILKIVKRGWGEGGEGVV